jgi:predicted RNA methylase
MRAMAIRLDPEENEKRARGAQVPDWRGRQVLEVGCGSGRLTRRYAAGAARVVAIDPDEDDIAAARRENPPALEGKVEYWVGDLEAYAASATPGAFDLVLLSWSL